MLGLVPHKEAIPSLALRACPTRCAVSWDGASLNKSGEKKLPLPRNRIAQGGFHEEEKQLFRKILAVLASGIRISGTTSLHPGLFPGAANCDMSRRNDREDVLAAD
jgi:hypothetical protein